MRSKQPDFFDQTPKFAPRRMTHGGLKSHAKFTRPLDRKKPVHLVLKASAAKGRLSLLTHKVEVERILKVNAKRFEVTIHHKENMGNHIHLVATFHRREGFQNFLRSITALIARKVTGARKGKPFGKRFWDQLAFTRVVNGFRDLKGVKYYLVKNKIERDFGKLSRKTVEEYERALAKARRLRVDVWRVLEENSG